MTKDEVAKKMEKYHNVYHRTNSNPDDIRRSGFVSKEQGKVFVSNRKNGQAKGYGKYVIPLKVYKHELSLDDEFPSGEKHYSMHHKTATNALKR
jgi:hypothetical protein